MSYTVTVKVELVDVPHTWVTFTDANGNQTSYGFAPFPSGTPIGFGEVYTGSDAGNEAQLSQAGYSATYEITEQQFYAMTGYAQAVAENSGLYVAPLAEQNCTGFVREVLRVGDVPHPLGNGPHPASLIPVRERAILGENSLQDFANNISENTVWLSNFMDGGLSADEFRDLFGNAEDASAPPPRRDPLTLDLDGDGLETIGVNAGAYFDHDGNGFAEQTGWVGADDGLLVWDRNSDGRINDDGELFGDQTRLQDGSLAANGFQALAEWDTISPATARACGDNLSKPRLKDYWIISADKSCNLFALGGVAGVEQRRQLLRIGPDNENFFRFNRLKRPQHFRNQWFKSCQATVFCFEDYNRQVRGAQVLLKRQVLIQGHKNVEFVLGQSQ